MHCSSVLLPNHGHSQVLAVSGDFSLDVTNPTGAHKHLHSTARRYSASIAAAPGDGCNATKPQTALKSCSVTVKDTSVALGKGVSEAYDLEITAAGACKINADTVWGAFHGMESLSQLAAENCTISNAPVRIRDSPRFEFRGLMIDVSAAAPSELPQKSDQKLLRAYSQTARHFMPISFIHHIIEGMAANKLNVLHWHIVDSQAFPYCSEKFPGLCGKGAYSPRATYTAAQLKDTVDYAESHGVRIMPEFDMP